MFGSARAAVAAPPAGDSKSENRSAAPLPPGFAGFALIAQPLVPDSTSFFGCLLPNGMQLGISRG